MPGTSLLIYDICTRMGLALTVWQLVEEQHYLLFLELLKVSDGDIPSVVYFSTESFDSRRKMVSRMFQYSGADKDRRTLWNDLDKRLKDYNDNRNKIAHYVAQLEIESTMRSTGIPGFKIGDYALVPSRFNRVSVLLGRTEDSPEHYLKSETLNQYIGDFQKLARDLEELVFAMRRERLPRQRIGLPQGRPEIKPPPPLNSAS